MVDVPQEVTGFGPQEDLFPEEPIGDGAIRMLAFGVLEFVPVPGSFHGPIEAHNELVNKAQEIEQLVCQEVNARGWKLSTIAYKTGIYILLGKLGGSVAMPVRPKIGQGTLQEVCRAAVDWIDNGPQPSKPPVR